MDKEICPETTANLFSRLTFSWMNRLMKRGYQRPLTDDTVDELHPDLRAALAVGTFQRHWGGLQRPPQRNDFYNSESSDFEDEKTENGSSDTPNNTCNKERPAWTKECREKQRHPRLVEHSSLLRALWRTFGCRLLLIQLWQLLHDSIWFTTPFVLGKLIEFIRNEDASSYQGYLLAICLYLSTLLRSICDKQVFHSSGILALKVRAALLSAVYRKALRLDVMSRQRRSAGEVVSLMSEDCEQLEILVTWLYQMWSAPLQLVVSLSLLYLVLGPAVLAGVAVIIVLIPVNIFILKCLRKSHSELTNLRDSRIKILSEVLNGIKVLKMYAWEPAFCEKIENCRKKELYLLWRNAIYDTFLHCSWTVVPHFITLAFFFTYLHTSTDQYLRPETVFMTLTVMKFITVAINIAPTLLSDAIKAAVSIGRLNQFLNQTELDERDDCKRNIFSREAHENCAVSIQQGTFSWGLNLLPTLKDVSLVVTPGSLVAVVGSVGSGKSSLLAAILGEMDRLSGTVQAEGVIAYVPQQAWIQHDTVRNNVLFGSAMDWQRYKACLSACALEPDLDILPGGDLTEIGERGINLSGGQKQRVSLARAIYSPADLFLLDDPLSSVDAHVGRHIFRRVFGKRGLLTDKTRILVTHGVQWLPEVDVIVMIAEGRIVEVGEYRQLMESCGPFAAYLRQCLTRSPGGDETSDSDEEVQAIKSVMLQRLLSTSDDGTSPLSSPVSPLSTLRAKTTTTTPSSPPASAGRTFSFLKPQTPSGGPSSSEILHRDAILHADNGCSTDPAYKQARVPTVRENDDDLAGKGANGLPSGRGNKDLRERRKKVKQSLSFDSEDVEDVDGGFQFLSNEAEDKKRRGRPKTIILQNKHKLVEAETLGDKTVPWRVYRELLTTLGWRSVVVISLVFAAHYVTSTLADVVLRDWTDDPRLADLTLFPPGSQERSAINGEYLRSYVTCGLSLAVLMVTYKILQKSRMMRVSRALHSAMLRSVLRAPITYFDVTPQGRLISRFSRDVRVVDEELHDSTSGTLEASCLVLCGLAVMVASAPWVALPLAPLLLFYLYVQRYYIASSRQLKRLSSRSRSPMYSFFSESLQGASVIRAFRAGERFEQRMESLCDENTRFRYYSYCSNRWLGFRLDLLGGLCVLMTSLTGVALRHTLSPGGVGLAVTYALSVTAILYFFVMSLGELENEVVCLERIAEVSNIQHEVKEVRAGIAELEAPWTIEGRQPRKAWPETGMVEITDIDLRYRIGLDFALKGVSFSIQGGKKVGIVGRTGAGKSSLTLALFRLLEVSKGHIDIDDLDVGSIGLHDLRDKIAVIPQDPTVFAGSIRSNLDPFSHHNDRDLWQALTHAHLQPFVSSLPLGLDSDCGEGGENLSMGQRQLLCLARAMLRRTNILVLDEATAAVDMATDQVIQQTLRSEFAHCTVLTIAHRLNTVMDYDKILVLDDGRVASFDSPQALLQDPDNLFSRLVASASHQQHH